MHKSGQPLFILFEDWGGTGVFLGTLMRDGLKVTYVYPFAHFQ